MSTDQKCAGSLSAKAAFFSVGGDSRIPCIGTCRYSPRRPKLSLAALQELGRSPKTIAFD